MKCCVAMLLQEYQVIVDCPQQLRVLQNLMERGKLTEKQCEIEKRNFVEYVRDKCKKIPLLSGHCIVVGRMIFLLCWLYYTVFQNRTTRSIFFLNT